MPEDIAQSCLDQFDGPQTESVELAKSAFRQCASQAEEPIFRNTNEPLKMVHDVAKIFPQRKEVGLQLCDLAAERDGKRLQGSAFSFGVFHFVALAGPAIPLRVMVAEGVDEPRKDVWVS